MRYASAGSLVQIYETSEEIDHGQKIPSVYTPPTRNKTREVPMLLGSIAGRSEELFEVEFYANR
jgi:hypothetical protein